MSQTEQPELTDFDSAPRERRALHEETLADRGAAYAPDDSAAASAPQQEPENCCLNCGAPIEAKTARVIGDNNGCVPACSEEECRKDVMGETEFAHDSYRETTRLVAAIRSSDGAGGVGR